MQLENVKALVEAEFEIPIAQQEILFNGQLLINDKHSLASYHVSQDDILFVRTRQTLGNTNMPRAELVRQQILSNPTLLQQITQVLWIILH